MLPGTVFVAASSFLGTMKPDSGVAPNVLGTLRFREMVGNGSLQPDLPPSLLSGVPLIVLVVVNQRAFSFSVSML